MSRPSRRLSVPAAITVAAVAVIVLIASGALRPTAVSGVPPTDAPWVPSVPPASANPAPANPSPSIPAPATPVPATPAPATPPPATPVQATPAPKPVDDFSDGRKTVKLDIATEHDLFIEVTDFTGTVVDATSGRAGDGMSVRWNDLNVENIDDDTLRLTWVGPPADDPIKLAIAHVDGNPDGKPTIVLMQLMPPENSDSIGFDRVLDLDFDSPVSADDFDTLVQDGYDTGG